MSDKAPAIGKVRNGEEIGGGYFVFRRHRKSKRVSPSPWPFEHPSMDAAFAEAERLAKASPEHEFVVLGEIGSMIVDKDGHETTVIRRGQK